MMQKTSDKLINIVLDGFQKNKGRASLYCFDKSAVNLIVLNVISKFHLKSPNSEILIIVDCYETRTKVNKFLKNREITVEKGYTIKLLSLDYIKPYYNYTERLVITVGVNEKFGAVVNILRHNNFFLHIMTSPVIEHATIDYIRSYCPDIDTTKFVKAVKADYINSPVEEHRFGVDITEHDRLVYERLTDYINTSVSIFGSIDTIEKCRIGDTENNISATEFRNNLAVENGWSLNLNTEVEFQKQIDDIYNPNALSERAHNFYTIAKQRKELVYDNYAKLEIIADIVKNNTDKKILIVSPRGEFAASITEYINKQFESIVCGDYHDCLDNVPAYNDYGEPILVKSGIKKGEHKMIGAQAQSTANERKFNDGIINVLSIKSTSNVKLKIACDMVIFTSSSIANMPALKSRFTNLEIANIPNLSYVLYCNDTIESVKLNEENSKGIVKKIVNENENNIEFDENNGNIIL